MIPDPPFVKNGTLTLLGLPKIDLSTIPLNARFFNVMNLPFVSQLVSFAIETVANDFIAPRSYTLDISKLLVGDDVKKETATMGVLMVSFHSATDVPKADHGPGRNKTDPYLTLSYRKFGKTMYSTRVIPQELNPVWEETCFIPILPDAVKAAEKIRVSLWDSDRISADDLLGRVDIDLSALVKAPGKFERRSDLVLGTRGTKINWSIGFFGRKSVKVQSVPKRIDTRIPPELRDSPDFQPDEARFNVDSQTESLVASLPPDPSYPGILSVQIHQIYDLAEIRPHATYGKRHNEQEDIEEAGEDDTSSAPSSYIHVVVNDEPVYKTRTRAFTNRPIFNASFERFVRNFNDTKIRIVVRDARLRESDPILGILPLSLATELEHHGQVTRWYSISEGIGYGRIRVSLLYRNINLTIPRALQGWNLGTLTIFGVKAFADEAKRQILKDTSLKISTMTSQKTIGSIHAKITDECCITWETGNIVMPIRRRHASSLCFEINQGGIPFSKAGLLSTTLGQCVISLSCLDDNSRKEIEIPIFQTNDYIGFRQNAMPNNDSEESGLGTDRRLERIGTMVVDCILESGLSHAHKKYAKRSSDLAQNHQAWNREQSLIARLDREKMNEAWHAKRVARTQGLASDNEVSDRTGNGVSEVEERERLMFRATISGASIPLPSSSLQFDSKSNTKDWDSSSSSSSSPEEGDDDSKSELKESHRSVKGWLKDKRGQQKELHRRHRGIMQQKPARTILWLKNGAKSGLSKVSTALSLKREDDLIENEV